MDSDDPYKAWRMLPTSDRRDLYVARHLSGALELVRAHIEAVGVDLDSMGPAYRDSLENGLRRLLVHAFDSGAEYEDGLRSAIHTQSVVQQQLEALLRAHGIRVPTRRIGSDPPP